MTHALSIKMLLISAFSLASAAPFACLASIEIEKPTEKKQLITPPTMPSELLDQIKAGKVADLKSTDVPATPIVVPVLSADQSTTLAEPNISAFQLTPTEHTQQKSETAVPVVTPDVSVDKSIPTISTPNDSNIVKNTQEEIVQTAAANAVLSNESVKVKTSEIKYERNYIFFGMVPWGMKQVQESVDNLLLQAADCPRVGGNAMKAVEEFKKSSQDDNVTADATSLSTTNTLNQQPLYSVNPHIKVETAEPIQNTSQTKSALTVGDLKKVMAEAQKRADEKGIAVEDQPLTASV